MQVLVDLRVIQNQVRAAQLTQVPGVSCALLLARNVVADDQIRFGRFRGEFRTHGRNAAFECFALASERTLQLLHPLLFLQSPNLQVVTLLPQYFQGEFSNDQTKILASAVMTAIPEIAAYLLMQKNFEKGMIAGALK